jgi:2-dehydropantoate 2-reductase
MKFLIVGPGAMGLLFASRLKKLTTHEIFLLDYKKERAEYLNKHGIRVEGLKGEFHVHVPTVTKEQVNFSPDFILIFVKAYSTKDVAYDLREIISEGSCVVTLQNGIGNIEILEDVLKKKVHGGVTAEGATLISTGHVRHAGYGDTIIGPSSEKLLKLKDVLNEAGFFTEVKDDIESFLWGKLLVNVGINALTAITGLRNGMLVQIEETKILMQECLKEAMEVVKKKKLKLPYDNPFQVTQQVCKKTAQNISSMLQDILAKRQTEIDFLNGAVVRESKKLGIDTPVNRALTFLVRAIQKTYEHRVDRK